MVFRRACAGVRAQQTPTHVRALSRKRFSVGDQPSHRKFSIVYVKASQSLRGSSFRGLKTSLNGIALEISALARSLPATLAVTIFPSLLIGPPTGRLLDSMVDTLFAAQTCCCNFEWVIVRKLSVRIMECCLWRYRGCLWRLKGENLLSHRYGYDVDCVRLLREDREIGCDHEIAPFSSKIWSVHALAVVS